MPRYNPKKRRRKPRIINRRTATKTRGEREATIDRSDDVVQERHDGRRRFRENETKSWEENQKVGERRGDGGEGHVEESERVGTICGDEFIERWSFANAQRRGDARARESDDTSRRKTRKEALDGMLELLWSIDRKRYRAERTVVTWMRTRCAKRCARDLWIQTRT